MHNFWCIDDDEETATSTVALLNASSDDLRVKLKSPAPLKELAAELAKSPPDGIILDLRLDEVPSSANYMADYRAGSLAQQLRSLAAEGAVPDIPVLLWSSEPNLKKSYDNDVLSHGLFDKVYIKNRIPDDPVVMVRELVAFSMGYRQLRNELLGAEPTLKGVLKVSGASADFIESVVLSSTSWEQLTKSTSSLARWILCHLMRSPGPLIDEPVLAARLGVDRQASPGWPKFRDKHLRDFRYEGPFAGVTPRWWAMNVESWWSAQVAPKQSLSLTPADERVALINSLPGASELVAASPKGCATSSLFWYVCEKTAVPLDPQDALALVDEDMQPWSEPFYVSIDYALTDSSVPLQHSERQRLQAIKAARKA